MDQLLAGSGSFETPPRCDMAAEDSIANELIVPDGNSTNLADDVCAREIAHLIVESCSSINGIEHGISEIDFQKLMNLSYAF